MRFLVLFVVSMAMLACLVEAGCRGSKCHKNRRKDDQREGDPMDKVEDIAEKRQDKPKSEEKDSDEEEDKKSQKEKEEIVKLANSRRRRAEHHLRRQQEIGERDDNLDGLVFQKAPRKNKDDRNLDGLVWTTLDSDAHNHNHHHNHHNNHKNHRNRRHETGVEHTHSSEAQEGSSNKAERTKNLDGLVFQDGKTPAENPAEDKNLDGLAWDSQDTNTHNHNHHHNSPKNRLRRHETGVEHTHSSEESQKETAQRVNAGRLRRNGNRLAEKLEEIEAEGNEQETNSNNHPLDPKNLKDGWKSTLNLGKKAADENASTKLGQASRGRRHLQHAHRHREEEDSDPNEYASVQLRYPAFGQRKPGRTLPLPLPSPEEDKLPVWAKKYVKEEEDRSDE